MESPTIATGMPSSRHRYFAVDLASLPADRQLSFDLYVNVEGNTILYREKTLPFSEEVRKRMLEHRVKQVYIQEKQKHAYLGYMEEELPGLLRDELVPSATKAQIVYATSKMIAENILSNPTFGDNLKWSEKLVEQKSGFLTRGPESFRHLVNLSDADYKLTSHSVNVCTYSLGLAQYLGVDDPSELLALGVGAMLHDVGKTRIDARIMRKRSPLSHAEFELMKKHVDFGVEILSGMKDLPKAACIPVMQHNEREDGSGYPRGLVGDQIHLFGKITALADVFDALTTERVYCKAFTAYDAFREMLKMPLDQTLLRSFIALLGPDTRS